MFNVSSNTVPTAALYLRQSLDVQEGIDRQRERCQKLAADRGWAVVDVYADNDVSASKARGPKTQWARMLADAKEGKFTVLVAVDLDRLIRGNKDLLSLIELGLKIVTVDGEVDLSTADGEFRANIMASVARFEVQRKAERQTRANAHRAAKGIPNAGARAFGWQKDKVTIEPVEAQWVRHMHTELINGSSIYSMCRTLNGKGVRTAQGKLWTPQQVRMVLKRPRNAGIFTRHGAEQETSKIEPIVSREDHELVLSILEHRSEPSPKKPEQNWLSGLILCSVCHSWMAAKTVTPSKKGEARVRTYFCNARIAKTAEPGVRHVSVKADVAESAVLMHLYGWYSAGMYKVSDPDTATLRQVELDLAENSRQKAAVMEMGTLPGADLKWVAKRLRELATEAENLTSRRAGLALKNAAAVDMYKIIEKKGDSGDTALEWLEWWKSLPIETRRGVIRDSFKITIGGPGKGAKRVKVEPVF
jgi:site-specific DNA recombinase